MDWSSTAPYLVTLLAGLILIWRWFSSLISHPCQLVPLLRLYWVQRNLQLPPNLSSNWSWIFTKLKETSRSFYFVIMTAPQLGTEAISIFYLAARALDTIEDDMQPGIECKQTELREFYKHLTEPSFSLKGFGEKPHEIEMLEHFGKIAAAFNTLSPPIQSTITRVIREMGAGMAKYLDKDVITLQDYDEYCHYVAGIVGIGIVQIGIDTGYQSEYAGLSLEAREELNNNAGVFLQKINIIRDFQEDIRVSRVFWPREIWSKYTSRLENFLLPGFQPEAVSCANELITNAMTHLPGVLRGMTYIDQKLFKFVAAPFGMALATYALCYNNPKLFRKTLKIRKGEAAYIFGKCDDFNNVKNVYNHYSEMLRKKAKMCGDKNAKVLMELLDEGRTILEEVMQQVDN